jgi:hypothetical protein
MGQELKISFDTPEDGWLAIYLDSGVHHLKLPFSYTPFDFLSELVRALLNLSDGFDAEANCSYNPDRYKFHFRAKDHNSQFEVVSYPDHRRAESSGEVIFSFEGIATDICSAFWRALRELQGRVSVAKYKDGFHRDFPEKEMRLLTEKMTAIKQQVRE